MLDNNYEFSYTDIKFFFNDNNNVIKKTDLPKIYDFNKFLNKSTMSTSSILLKKKIINQISFSECKTRRLSF